MERRQETGYMNGMAKRSTGTSTDDYQGPGMVRLAGRLRAAARSNAEGVAPSGPTPDEIEAAILRLQGARDDAADENALMTIVLDEIDMRLASVNADLDRMAAA